MKLLHHGLVKDENYCDMKQVDKGETMSEEEWEAEVLSGNHFSEHLYIHQVCKNWALVISPL